MLDTRANNLRFNKSLRKKLIKYGDSDHYPKYDNYDAIEVPLAKCIPSDYKGVMGVPITFLDNYSPEQFELIGHEHDLEGNGGDKSISQFMIHGKGIYKRILIKHKKN